MRKFALIILTVLALGALTLTSCKSEEQKLLDWYHENYDDVKSRLPPKEACDRWLPAYSAMISEIESSNGPLQAEIYRIASLVRQGYISREQGDQMRKPVLEAHLAWLRNRSDAFQNQTQLSGLALHYCNTRLVYAYSPDSCSDVAQHIIPFPHNWSKLDVFAVVEYCLENWPGFLETK